MFLIETLSVFTTTLSCSGKKGQSGLGNGPDLGSDRRIPGSVELAVDPAGLVEIDRQGARLVREDS